MYQHTFLDGRTFTAPSKVVCVGRNYLEHIRELDNPVPTEPILFIKPTTSLVALSEPIRLPAHSQECHHEVEVAVLIGEKLTNAVAGAIDAAIAGYGLALDLTLRDVQSKLKQQGHPWELAKAFDNSCPISPFVDKEHFDPGNISFSLHVNGEERQQGNTKLMMVGIFDLIAHMSRFFTLLPGDVVLTGTPQGVAPLRSGDAVSIQLAEEYNFHTSVV